MIELDELKRLLAEYRQWDVPGEVVALDTSAAQRRQQIRLEVMNALPDLIAEIERLAKVGAQDTRDYAELHRKYHEAMSIMSEWRNIDSADAVAQLQVARERIARLEAALRALLSEGSIDERKRGFVEGLLSNAQDAD